jgi:hypothetical protein
MLSPKKSWNSLSLSLSLSQELSISMQNSTINQPKNYGFHSVQNSLSTNSINQQKRPKVMEFLSRTLSRYKFQPTQKAQQLWNSLQNSLSTNSNQPKNPNIMVLSQDLSLSLNANFISQSKQTQKQKNKKIMDFLQNSLNADSASIQHKKPKMAKKKN